MIDRSIGSYGDDLADCDCDVLSSVKIVFFCLMVDYCCLCMQALSNTQFVVELYYEYGNISSRVSVSVRKFL